MIKITNTATFGFEGAIRGMRNPYESHEKSDSYSCHDKVCDGCDFISEYSSKCGWSNVNGSEFFIGEADMALIKKLIKAGPEHRKFLRMIHVQADVKAPRYWWVEMDKYKYVEANSSSTMHLITKRPLTVDDFSVSNPAVKTHLINNILKILNLNIQRYNEQSDKELKDIYFSTIKQLLPESYNQLRTIDTDYECLLSIYKQRKNHRLLEWREFCNWVETLPYMEEFLA